MKILLVTRQDPFTALTGVAVYVRDLAEALAGMGHEAVHLYVDAGAWPCGPRLRWSCRDGRLLAAVAGCPAVSCDGADGLAQDVTRPSTERLLERALLRIDPDLVHLHDLSGIPAAFIHTAKARGYPVVVTLHDFWPFCRQLLLIRPGLVPCAGSDGGRSCARFCSTRPGGLRRALRQLEAVIPSARARLALRRTVGMYHRLRGRSQFAAGHARPAAGNTEEAPPPALAARFAEREALMRAAVLRADAILTVSAFARATYARHGYPADRMRVLPLCLAATDRIRWRGRTVTAHPVRVGYVGAVTPWKGAHLLAAAAAGLPPAQVRIEFYGAITGEDQRFLRSLAGTLADVRFHGRYAREQLPDILDRIDVMVFPSIMSETQGLVGLEAQAAGLPIIGAAHGAIPEWVQHDVNGLLFSPGSAESLRAQILRVLSEPGLIARLSSNVRRPAPMSAHVRAVAGIYAGVAATTASRPADARRAVASS